MSDIFISYARLTAADATRIAEALRAVGHHVWMDEQLPAHRTYADVIEERLAAAKAVLVLWSHEAVKSHWVRSEANRAREGSKLVQAALDGARLPMPFDQIQCADLSGWRGAPDAPGWRKVLASIEELVGAGPTPTPAAPDAVVPSLRKPASQGNLPAQTNSFVGRETEVAELLALTNTHRLLTLTGVGGVGKTRLALEVARQAAGDFPDGAWLVELAPVSDPAAVPDTVAMALGITPQGARSIANAIADALSGRRLLIVIDNCEHVLDAIADLVETLLSRVDDVRIIATSREGLRVDAEHLWPLQTLDTRAGVDSSAVQLFMARAQAVKRGFTLSSAADAEAVVQICARLDGIALAIELAAARMVSMTAPDLLDRLGDRFRLLSRSRRGLDHHQTLRQAVQWSYDLLSDDERALLDHCSVFAGDFDLRGASRVCGGEKLDEYAVLDLLDSLVRKSLVTAETTGDHMRYGLLETIRQFAEERLAATGRIDELRAFHARHFAEQAVAHWENFLGPRQREVIDWADIEYANLRAGFRWAADNGELDTAADIAAHTAGMCIELSRFEPTRWAEEIVPAATRADIRRLPRLLSAAILAGLAGRWEPVPAYCRAALRLRDDPRYDPFDPGYGVWLAALLLFQTGGDSEESLAIFRELSARPGLAGAAGLSGVLLVLLQGNDRNAEARAVAEDAVAAARAHGYPTLIVLTECWSALAHVDSDLALAQRALQSAVAYSRKLRLENSEATCLQQMAMLEALAGDLARSLVTFDRVIDACQRSGYQFELYGSFWRLAYVFTWLKRPEVAATLLGGCHFVTSQGGLPAAERYVRAFLDEQAFATCLGSGAAMELPAAVRYAREQISLAQREMAGAGAAP